MKSKVIIVFILGLFLIGCQKKENTITKDIKMEDKQNMLSIQMKINNQIISTQFYDNETTRELLSHLPLETKLNDLNNNEKYVYLDFHLPSNKESIESIKAGDIMLFQSDCLVIFYEDFDTSYQYTRLGYIEDIPQFLKLMKNQNLILELERKDKNETN